MDRGDEEFYYSEAYQVPAGMTAAKASWEATMTSTNNWVTMQVRCADSVEELEKAKDSGEKRAIKAKFLINFFF